MTTRTFTCKVIVGNNNYSISVYDIYQHEKNIHVDMYLDDSPITVDTHEDDIPITLDTHEDDIPITLDTHEDTTHEDTTHEDTTHEDTTHEDKHEDTTHEDTTHEDTTHEDTTHEDTTHEDKHEDTTHEDTTIQIGYLPNNVVESYEFSSDEKKVIELSLGSLIQQLTEPNDNSQPIYNFRSSTDWSNRISQHNRYDVLIMTHKNDIDIYLEICIEIDNFFLMCMTNGSDNESKQAYELDKLFQDQWLQFIINCSIAQFNQLIYLLSNYNGNENRIIIGNRLVLKQLIQGINDGNLKEVLNVFNSSNIII
jgi:hypothetical protein